MLPIVKLMWMEDTPLSGKKEGFYVNSDWNIQYKKCHEFSWNVNLFSEGRSFYV